MVQPGGTLDHHAFASLGQPAGLGFTAEGFCVIAMSNGNLVRMDLVPVSAATPALPILQVQPIDNFDYTFARYPQPLAVAPAGPSLWPLLLVPRSAYNPAAVAEALASHGTCTVLTEPCPGPDACMLGVTPLMQMIHFGDQDNALELIHRLQAQGCGSWNNIFMKGREMGVNAFLYALKHGAEAVALALSALPQVDLQVKGSYMVQPGYVATNEQPGIMYALDHNWDQLLERIVAANAGNPDYFRFEFTVDPHRTKVAAMRPSWTVAQLMQDPVVQSLYRNQQVFKAAYNSIKAILKASKPQKAPRSLPVASGPASDAEGPLLEAPPSAAPERAPDRIQSEPPWLTHLLQGLKGLDQAAGKLHALEAKADTYRRLRLEFPEAMRDCAQRDDRIGKKFKAQMEALDRVPGFLATAPAELGRLETEREALLKAGAAGDQDRAKTLLAAFRTWESELNRHTDGFEEKVTFLSKAIAAERKTKQPKTEATPPLPTRARTPSPEDHGTVIPDAEATAAPEAVPTPLPRPPKTLAPPKPAPLRVAEKVPASSSSSGYRPVQPLAASLSLRDKLNLGDATQLPELLVLEQLLAVTSFEEAALQEMEKLALFGSCARVMDQAKSKARHHLFDPKLAGHFRDVVFHEAVSGYQLQEVKTFAYELMRHAQAQDGKPLANAALFAARSAFFRGIQERVLPVQTEAEGLTRMKETETRYEAIKAYAPQDQDEALLKARAMGFLEARLGALCSAWFKGRGLASAVPAKATLPADYSKLIRQGIRFRHGLDYAPLAEVKVAAPATGAVAKPRLRFVFAQARLAPAGRGSLNGAAPGTLAMDYPDILEGIDEAARAALDALPGDLQAEICQSARRWSDLHYYQPSSPKQALSERVLALCQERRREAAHLLRQKGLPSAAASSGPATATRASQEPLSGTAPRASRFGTQNPDLTRLLTAPPGSTPMKHLVLEDLDFPTAMDVSRFAWALADQRDLEFLSLNNCTFHGKLPLLLNVLPQWAANSLDAPNLHGLVLRRVGLTSDTLPSLLKALRSFSQLSVLDVAGNGLGLGDANQLCQALRDAGAPLECLILSHNLLGGHGDSQALASLLRPAGALQFLSLAECELDPALVTTLTQSLAGNQTLTHLNLAGNRLEDTAAFALASALGTMPQLEDLDLRDNAFTDTGFQALVEAIRQHPGIKSLRLLNLGLNSEPYQEAVDQILGR